MFRADPLMAHADRHGLRRLEEALGAVGEFFEVHDIPMDLDEADVVLLKNHTRGDAE